MEKLPTSGSTYGATRTCTRSRPLGAFTTTFGSFLIPALAWNLYYNSDERVKQMPKPIALGLQVPTVKVMNWVFILIILVLGLGMGGWASIKTMDEKVKEFELFDRCNGC